MPLRFACTCGQQLAVREDLVGRKVRCTACSEVITVPDEPGATASVARRAAQSSRAIKSSRDQELEERPSRAARRRDEDEDQDDRQERDDREPDQDEEDLRPRRKRKKKAAKNNKGLLIAALVGVLLLGGGLLGWWLLGKRSGSASADFDLVPRDAAAFITIRFGDIFRTDAGKRALDEIRKSDPNALAEMNKASGLSPEDIERVTVVVASFNEEDVYAIIRSSKPYDKDAILRDLGNVEERKQSGKAYTYGLRANVAFHFADKTLFVVGKEAAVKKCLSLPSKPASGALDEYLALASQDNYQTVGAVIVPADKLSALRQQAGMMVPVNALFDTKAAYLTASFGNKIESELGLVLPDKDKAAAAVNEVNNLVGMLKGVMALQARNIPGEARNLLTSSLDQFKPKQDGNKVVVTNSMDANQYVGQIAQLMKMFSANRAQFGQPNFPQQQPRLPAPPRPNPPPPLPPRRN